MVRFNYLVKGLNAMSRAHRVGVAHGLGVGEAELPIGVLAHIESDRLTIHSMVASPDGSEILRETWVGAADDPCRAGAEAAALLVDRGADTILEGPAFRDEDVPDDDDGWRDVVAGLLAPTEAEWESEVDPEDD